MRLTSLFLSLNVFTGQQVVLKSIHLMSLTAFSSWHGKINSLYYDQILAHMIVLKAASEFVSGKEGIAWFHLIKYCFKF